MYKKPDSILIQSIRLLLLLLITTAYTNCTDSRIKQANDTMNAALDFSANSETVTEPIKPLTQDSLIKSLKVHTITISTESADYSSTETQTFDRKGQKVASTSNDGDKTTFHYNNDVLQKETTIRNTNPGIIRFATLYDYRDKRLIREIHQTFNDSKESDTTFYFYNTLGLKDSVIDKYFITTYSYNDTICTIEKSIEKGEKFTGDLFIQYRHNKNGWRIKKEIEMQGISKEISNQSNMSQAITYEYNDFGQLIRETSSPLYGVSYERECFYYDNQLLKEVKVKTYQGGGLSKETITKYKYSFYK